MIRRLFPSGADSDAHFLRSAYSLIINTAASGALGVAFWIVAARFFPADTVGRDSVLIVTMMTVSTICQVNLPNLFARFLPEQTDPSRVILWGFGINCGLALVLGGVGMAVLPRVSDDLAGLGYDGWLGWAWTASLALWGVFALQDAALTGLRHAPWVATKSSVYGLMKLLCLPLFMLIDTDAGVFLAWVVPMFVLLLPVNAIVFGRAVRRHVPSEDAGATGGFRSRTLRRFLAYDYVASTFIQGLYTVLPLLVLGLLGTTVNAYFWIPFSLITAVDMMSLSIATSMTVEGAFAKDKLADLARTAVRRFALLVVGVSAVLALAAPIILIPFGPDYVDNGTSALRVLAIGVICHGVIELYVAVARVQQRGRALALVASGRSLIALALCSVLGAEFGLMGIAWGWSLMAIIVALAVLPSVIRTLRPALAAEGEDAVAGGPRRAAPGLVAATWAATGGWQRVALAGSVLCLVTDTGVVPAPAAAIITLIFLLSAPGVALITLLERRGRAVPLEPALVAALGLATGVLLAQTMLWLDAWQSRVWVGLLAVACIAIIGGASMPHGARALRASRLRDLATRVPPTLKAPADADAKAHR